VTRAICITFNTAIDIIVDIASLEPGTTFRATSSIRAPAGKAVNAAVGIATLGEPALATGFVGKQSRDVFEELRDEGVEPRFIEVPGTTRTNLTLLERDGRETHIQTTGFAVSSSAIRRLALRVDKLVNDGDVVVFGGSYPSGVPAGFAATLITSCKSRGAHVIVDSSGAALREAMSAGPSTIKPNVAELFELIDRPVSETEDDIIVASRLCLAAGVGRIVVSRGHKGLLVIDNERALRANVDIGRHLVTASVGSGDSVVAALAFSLIRCQTVEDTARLAAACGAANLFTKLPGRFNKAKVEFLQTQTQVSPVDH